MTVQVSREGPVTVVTIDRPERRNAVDRDTALALYDAFKAFDSSDASVAVLAGAGGTFCAGADLKAVAEGRRPVLSPDGDIGPMGPTRLLLAKPVVAAIEGFAVAGGLELALWCDLRVVADNATMGVFCRRFGVPLIDGGTVRLPRLIGESRALDLILTGRPVDAAEALQIGLANRVVPAGGALSAAVALAHEIARFPQGCMRADRMSLYRQHGQPEPAALRQEFVGGAAILEAEAFPGARRFASGAGRHGSFREE